MGERVIQYLSHQLNETQERLPVIEKEAYPIAGLWSRSWSRSRSESIVLGGVGVEVGVAKILQTPTPESESTLWLNVICS